MDFTLHNSFTTVHISAPRRVNKSEMDAENERKQRKRIIIIAICVGGTILAALAGYWWCKNSTASAPPAGSAGITYMPGVEEATEEMWKLRWNPAVENQSNYAPNFDTRVTPEGKEIFESVGIATETEKDRKESQDFAPLYINTQPPRVEPEVRQDPDAIHRWGYGGAQAWRLPYASPKFATPAVGAKTMATPSRALGAKWFPSTDISAYPGPLGTLNTGPVGKSRWAIPDPQAYARFTKK